MTDITQADVETRTRSWSITNDAGVPLAPANIRIVVRGRNDTDVIYTTTGTDATIAGLTSAGDGTGTWTITAGDLPVGKYRWWAIVGIGTETIIPTSMTGTITIQDR